MIHIVIPSVPRKKIITGNFQTSVRYKKILQQHGIKSNIICTEEFDNKINECGKAILLHATKNHSTAQKCKKKMIPYILVLTGTDIYGDILIKDTNSYKNCIESITGASSVITLQPHAKKKLLEIVPKIEKKVFVVQQSSFIGGRKSLPNSADKISILMVGNIRKEKDTLTGLKGFLDAFLHITESVKKSVIFNHIGQDLDNEYSINVKKYAHGNTNVNFLGPKINSGVIDIMRKSDLFLSSSIIEGGCLAIKEAVDLELPILASDIPCHKEILGSNYPGLFSTRSYIDLSKKMQIYLATKKKLDILKSAVLNTPLANYKLKDEAKLLLSAISIS